MMIIRTCLLSLCFFLFIDHSLVSAGDRPVVFVSIAPQKFFVQQISGDLLQVEVLVPPGASPHTYEPKPSQMKALSTAAAYFAIGVDFERIWLDRLAGVNPRMRIVHTDAGIEKRPMVEHRDDELDVERAHHSPSAHDDNHAHEEGLDPHIWLAPELVTHQAATIAAALSELFPDQAGAFAAGLASLQTQIDALDRELRTLLTDKQGLEFIVFHPSWGYFARSYGLVQVPVEVSGKNPKPTQLRTLIEHARRHGIRVVFAQPQLSTKSAEVITREIDGTVILLDPLAENWLTNMKAVAEQIHTALR
ncbi:metal ABC transporter solute-binding protein, Zn/Mn family [Desulfofustis limnaeus]|jgi:zinc transport system substrate-binding protein|uniref:metal ABC transporter solute-binding protein, Zn/Mn family n=1 Tax=Desulfofustis limnaeus TaxID=2740163 RepID=UPI0024DFD3D0|nr:zinc ABC transporter substrate-binding protein [Desulfofustis limnaeus]MDX9895513.1 zinc ABC transporter substrate-binding protein [Desulfofustis sp.]